MTPRKQKKFLAPELLEEAAVAVAAKYVKVAVRSLYSQGKERALLNVVFRDAADFAPLYQNAPLYQDQHQSHNVRDDYLAAMLLLSGRTVDLAHLEDLILQGIDLDVARATTRKYLGAYAENRLADIIAKTLWKDHKK